MAMEPYHFKPNSASLTEQADGTWVANFELAIYQGQTLKYTDQGINTDNYRVIDVEVERDENAPLSYQPGSTAPFAKTTEIGVELVSKKDGHKKDGIRITYS